MKLTEHRARQLTLPQSGQRFTFCDEVRGFGVRCTPGARTYIVQLRYNGRKLRLTLGPVGTLPSLGRHMRRGPATWRSPRSPRRGEDPRLAIGQQPAGPDARAGLGRLTFDNACSKLSAEQPTRRGVLRGLAGADPYWVSQVRNSLSAASGA